jgi:hypothetical protein
VRLVIFRQIFPWTERRVFKIHLPIEPRLPRFSRIDYKVLILPLFLLSYKILKETGFTLDQVEEPWILHFLPSFIQIFDEKTNIILLPEMMLVKSHVFGL